MLDVIPVSYTHLDVYKRQVLCQQSQARLSSRARAQTTSETDMSETGTEMTETETETKMTETETRQMLEGLLKQEGQLIVK